MTWHRLFRRVLRHFSGSVHLDVEPLHCTTNAHRWVDTDFSLNARFSRISNEVGGNHELRRFMDLSDEEPFAGVVKDSSVELRRFVLMRTLYLSVSQGANNTIQKRGAHAGGYARENLLHERIWSHLVVMFFFAFKTALLGQFSPTGS